MSWRANEKAKSKSTPGLHSGFPCLIRLHPWETWTLELGGSSRGQPIPGFLYWRMSRLQKRGRLFLFPLPKPPGKRIGMAPGAVMSSSGSGVKVFWPSIDASPTPGPGAISFFPPRSTSMATWTVCYQRIYPPGNASSWGFWGSQTPIIKTPMTNLAEIRISLTGSVLAIF